MSLINTFRNKIIRLKNDLEYNSKKVLSLKIMYLDLDKNRYDKEIQICNDIIDSLTINIQNIKIYLKNN